MSTDLIQPVFNSAGCYAPSPKSLGFAAPLFSHLGLSDGPFSSEPVIAG